ncbi:serine/threonine protein kinase [Aliishimia ponticola]|uniref:Serine/threonine protein kinase n=1 Tax=Aliishimia ponticola TaxID=2499833 RepID=A0A4S4ND23_9RHOB|nr:serine/threonine protein kinase [Aliishimia ponticola]THH36655.1 serine/threonine protein kinase [Aliishimia ponticola]
MTDLFSDFEAETVLKRDEFSETVLGHRRSNPSEKLVLRRLDTVPWYFRALSQWLARREVRGLKAVQRIEGAPDLIDADTSGILRVWTPGTPLQLARPADAKWYHDAKRVLREMRRAGITHNDLAKPQNWLMLPDGRAGVIDFQLAHVYRRKGKIFRIAAREDLRHLLKQKRRYAPDLLTPSEKRMLARKSLPAQLWMATGKRLYNFVTRRLMHWSDGEGDGDVLALHGDALRQAFLDAGAREVQFATYPMPSGGRGLYAFVEAETDLAPDTPVPVTLTQRVCKMPSGPEGAIWTEMLHLIANNRVDEIEALLDKHPDLRPGVRAVMQGRLNLTDRHR